MSLSKALYHLLFFVALPFSVTKEIEIVDIKFQDGWHKKCVTLKPGKDSINAEIDLENMWNYVYLIDSNDRKWHTIDGGQRWVSGLMEFDLSSL